MRRLPRARGPGAAWRQQLPERAPGVGLTAEGARPAAEGPAGPGAEKGAQGAPPGRRCAKGCRLRPQLSNTFSRET